jgi:hypothetical protein
MCESRENGDVGVVLVDELYENRHWRVTTAECESNGPQCWGGEKFVFVVVASGLSLLEKLFAENGTNVCYS